MSSKEIIEYYYRDMFFYIKEVVDQIEKNGEGLTTKNVVNGFNVLSNVYMLSLTEDFNCTNASLTTRRAASIYIDFIMQMTGLELNSDSAVKIGTRDAGMFVYKKVLSSLYEPKEDPSGSTYVKAAGILDSSPGAITSKKSFNNKKTLKLVVRENMNENFMLLQQHKCILRNVVYVLFSHPIFYDEKTDTMEFYSYVINKLIFMASVIEKEKMKHEKCKQVVDTMFEKGKINVDTKEDVDEYINWVISLIK
tara:strand:- start:15697 stop:16449 length:753 start_codon:yes stop_codon:yes gene_type:complete